MSAESNAARQVIHKPETDEPVPGSFRHLMIERATEEGTRHGERVGDFLEARFPEPKLQQLAIRGAIKALESLLPAPQETAEFKGLVNPTPERAEPAPVVTPLNQP